MLTSYRGSGQTALYSFNFIRAFTINLFCSPCERRYHEFNKPYYQGYRFYTQSALDDDFVDIDAGIATVGTVKDTLHEMNLTNASQNMLGVIRAPSLPANLRYSRLHLPLMSKTVEEKFVRPNSRSCKHVSQVTEMAEMNDVKEKVDDETPDLKVSNTSHSTNNAQRNNEQMNNMQEILQKINNGYSSSNDENDVNNKNCNDIVGNVSEHTAQNKAMTAQHTLQNEFDVARIGSKRLTEKVQNKDDYDELCEWRMKKPESQLDDSNKEISSIHKLEEEEEEQEEEEEEKEKQLRQYHYSMIEDDALPFDDEKFAETILEMEVEGAIDEAWQDTRKAELIDVKEITEVLKQMKVRDICCIDVSAKTGSFDYIIFATCEGARHIHLSAWAVQEADSLHRVSKVKRRKSDETWEVVPVGRILVNLMLESTRLRLMLERKWAVTSFMDPLMAANAPISEGRNVKSHGLWTLTLNLQDLKDFEVDYCKDVLLRQL